MTANQEKNEWLPGIWHVLATQQEASDVVTLEIAPRDSIIKFSIAPGQFNMLYGFAMGEIPISLSGSTQRGFLHTIRNVGAISNHLTHLLPGESIGVRGPFGKGWHLPDAKGCDVLVLAGGLGIAPLRPLIHQLISHRSDYGSISILYGGRHPEQMLFSQDLHRWQSSVKVLQTVDHGNMDWPYHIGVVTDLFSEADFRPDLTCAYICGPEIMMKLSAQALLSRGVASKSIFLSMERNMKCAIGVCGHCQWGPHFICKNGPVYRYDNIAGLLSKREV